MSVDLKTTYSENLNPFSARKSCGDTIRQILQHDSTKSMNVLEGLADQVREKSLRELE